jgi:hypothetical protein
VNDIPAAGPVYVLLEGALQVEAQHAVKQTDIEGIWATAGTRLGGQQPPRRHRQRKSHCQELATAKTFYRHSRIG